MRPVSGQAFARAFASARDFRSVHPDTPSALEATRVLQESLGVTPAVLDELAALHPQLDRRTPSGSAMLNLVLTGLLLGLQAAQEQQLLDEKP